MLRIIDDSGGIPGLRDGPPVQDEDPVADLIRGREVVGDKEKANAEILLQLEHALEDLGSQRGIDHGDRFVGNNEARFQHEGAGYDDPLSLSTRELKRVFSQDLLRSYAHDLQRLLDHPSRPSPAAGQLKSGDGHIEHVISAIEEVKDGVWVLENGLALAAVSHPFFL